MLSEVDRILAGIDAEALAEDCLAFVGVEGETGDEGRAAERFAEMLGESGWEPALDEVSPGRPNVAARLPGTGGGPTLVLNGHLDTIPVGKAWPPRRDAERIHGRGAEDMRGGLVAMVHAARALARAGVRLRGDLWLTAVVGHETAVAGREKDGPRRLIQRIREGAIRPDAILIAEGPAAIWSASLGYAVFSLTLDAGRAPVHTIGVPYRDNPARCLASLFPELDRLDDRLAADEPHALAGRGQVNVGVVAAGDYYNRLPTRITVTGTRRWTPRTTADDVRAELSELGDRVAVAHGLRSSLELAGVREPFEMPRAHPLVQAVLRAGEAATGKEPDVIGMALVCDASLYANEARVPTVCYGPAYATAHSDAESVAVADLVRAARVYALAAMEFCGV